MLRAVPSNGWTADGKESWEIYAESRGGAVRIEIANQYTFIFRDAAFRAG